VTHSPAGAVSDESQRLDWVVLLPSTVELPVDDALILGGDAAFGSTLVTPVRKRFAADDSHGPREPPFMKREP